MSRPDATPTAFFLSRSTLQMPVRGELAPCMVITSGVALPIQLCVRRGAVCYATGGSVFWSTEDLLDYPIEKSCFDCREGLSYR
jgi:hypothetical protein